MTDNRLLVRRLVCGAAFTLLSMSFVLAIAYGLDSSAANSNEHVAALASPTPRRSAAPQISRTDADPTSISPDAIVVAIPEDGEFYINRVRVERNDVPPRVGALVESRPPEQQIVYIRAAATVRHGTVVSLIDSLRELGVEQIGLVADRREAEFSSVTPQESRLGEIARRRSQAIQPTDEIVVTVGIGGPRAPNVRINSMGLFLSELGATLREILAAREDKTVFIEGSELSQFGDIVQILDVVKAAGAQPIGLRLTSLQAMANRALNSNNRVGGQRFTLNERSISFVPPIGWQFESTEDSAEGREHTTFITANSWRGPDRTQLQFSVTVFPPDVRILREVETDERYRRLLSDRTSEDVRLLEIDGVRGAHWVTNEDQWPYLRGTEVYVERARVIRWQGWRMYRGRRQEIRVVLSSPSVSFSRHRGSLYGILNSIRFVRE